MATIKKRLTRSQALVTAARYGLAREVAYEIDHNDCTPEEALAEWDILLYKNLNQKLSKNATEKSRYS